MEIISILNSIVDLSKNGLSIINGLFSSMGETGELIKFGIAFFLGWLISRRTSLTFIFVITGLIIYLLLKFSGG